MEKRQHIIILGNSLILGALGECLRHGDRFDLTTLTQPPQAMELGSTKPDVVLFDLESPYLESIFMLPTSCPKLLLIGVSSDTNLVKVWVGRQLHELSMQGLLTVINEHLQIKSPMVLYEESPNDIQNTHHA